MALENWLETIKKAKKTAIIQNDNRKVHFLFDDGQQMVEEYNTRTNVVTRRAWREKGKLGQDNGWIVEVGDPEPSKIDTLENFNIKESSSAPIVSRRITKLSLEWRIRNLEYPENVYSVTAEDDTIIIRTSNKKYYKKLKVPDLERIHLKPEQDRIKFTHKYNTLIITYDKPPALLQLEKEILNVVLSLPTREEGDPQCPTN